MIESDSRVPIIREVGPVYVTSAPRDSEWGQPSASYYVFVTDGSRMHGELVSDIYMPSPPSETLTSASRLAFEFEAWDALSDEALMHFEQELS